MSQEAPLITFTRKIADLLEENVPNDFCISQRYLAIEQALIRSETERVTIFNGGPLDYGSFKIDNAWLIPAEVRLDSGHVNFHVVTINCQNGTDLRDAAVYIHILPEHSIKLIQESTAVDAYFNDLKGKGTEKRVVVRVSFVGSLAFPKIQTPFDAVKDSGEINDALNLLLGEIGLPEQEVSEELFAHSKELESECRMEFKHCMLMEPIKIKSKELGTVYIHNIYAYDDPWIYYQIFSFVDLPELVHLPRPSMRVDSGCDSGMLYCDQGCDCHDQLLDALRLAKEEGGFVFHCPTQDGRGYGMVTKMETESSKHGVPTSLNGQVDNKITTLTAARALFGDHYDIRTYPMIGRILADLGFRDLEMITDNKRKVQQVLSGSRKISVRRKPTCSASPTGKGYEIHVQEKHSSPEYF